LCPLHGLAHHGMRLRWTNELKASCGPCIIISLLLCCPRASPRNKVRRLWACLVHFPTQPGSHQPARPPLARLSACRCVCLVVWFSAVWTHAAGVWFLEPVSDSNCEDAGTMFGCLHRSWSSYHFVWVVRLTTSLEFSIIIYSRWIYIILKSKVKITTTWINTNYTFH
jgi:hypothetical protein